MQVFGYHGTTKAAADNILSGSAFKKSDNQGDWLGTGVYFFQDAPVRALHWAKDWACGGDEEAAVLRAPIDLSDCLDLLDAPRFYELRGRFSSLDRSALPPQTPLSVNNGKSLLPGGKGAIRNFVDKALIDFTAELLEETEHIGSVRGAFLWGKAVFTESFIFSRSHVQIAVRDLSRIGVPDLWTPPSS